MKEQIVTVLRDAMDFGATEKQSKGLAYTKSVDIFNTLLEQAEKKEPREKELVCGEGCSACCIGRVAVCPTEVWVVQHISPFTYSELGEKLNKNDRVCPYLVNDSCSIYEYRPMKCRGANSYDAEFCKDPPLIFLRKTAPIWNVQVYIADQIHQALCEVYGEKARPMIRVVEEYNGKRDKE